MELLRDRSEEFRTAGVQPYAISRDSPWTHVAWTQALDLDFPLLSDWNAEATLGFGVAFEHNGMPDAPPRRATAAAAPRGRPGAAPRPLAGRARQAARRRGADRRRKSAVAVRPVAFTPRHGD